MQIDNQDLCQDLRFAPVRNAHPCVLTYELIAHYNSHGFIQPFDIFTPDEMRDIRAYIDRLIADMGDDGAYGINCYQARLSGLWDIATEPRILNYVQDIIGPDILCWASAVLSKAPRNPKEVPWHQDAGFWQLTPARTVTVWLAIDDVDESNAAMRFIPATHDKGMLNMSKTGGEAVFHKQTENAEALGTPFSNNLKAGQISLHADMLVHGSLPNRSDQRRCGLTLRYCPPEVRITDKQWANGVEAILCRGEPDDWNIHPRPENNDITRTTSPHVVGNN